MIQITFAALLLLLATVGSAALLLLATVGSAAASPSQGSWWPARRLVICNATGCQEAPDPYWDGASWVHRPPLASVLLAAAMVVISCSDFANVSRAATKAPDNGSEVKRPST